MFELEQKGQAILQSPAKEALAPIDNHVAVDVGVSAVAYSFQILKQDYNSTKQLHA